MLRQLFPRVPILALSATCPNKVLEDLLKILNMKRTVDGNGVFAYSYPLLRWMKVCRTDSLRIQFGTFNFQRCSS
jgi:superfamily II DNA helicase RecQ